MLSTYAFLFAVSQTIYARIDRLDAIDDALWTDALDAYYEHLYDLAEKAIEWANMC